MENTHKRLCVLAACGQEDRISNLPDQLIYLILELLPIQDAVRTSILSKQWRYKWTTMGTLVFDAEFSKKFAPNGTFGRNGFTRIINHVLLFHKGPISKFHLHIPYLLTDSFQDVDRWISMLSRNDVREFLLTNISRGYRLPSFVFSCLELRKLRLLNCIMTSSVEFQGFPNLEDLCLQYIDFEANSGGTVINLPQLKSLSLYKCTNANNFNIKATKLLALHVTDCPDVTSLRLFHSQCLTSLFMYCSKPTDGSAQFDKMVLHKMLSNAPSLTHFFTNGYFLKFYIAEYVPKLSPCTLNSLKYLGLLNINFGDLVQLRAAVCMLRNLPGLETLSVRNEQMGLSDVHFDVKPASYCIYQPLKRLQTIKIVFAEGSQPELLFVRVLLDHSPALKKMRITLGTTIASHNRLSFANNVMGFPRALEKVEILVDSMPIATKFPQLQ